MSEPVVEMPQSEPSGATPMGVRIAGTLSGLVGVLSMLVAAAVGIPALGGADGSILPLAVGLIAGAGACVAALLLWRRRRAGVLVLVLAFAVPTSAALALGAPVRGNIFITVALLLAAANWKHLR